MRKIAVLFILTLLCQGVLAQEPHHDHEHKPQHHKQDGHKSNHHGKHGHHDFSDAEKWIEKFEDPARDEWQKPDLVVEMLKLTPGMNVADIGAASGYFTRRMAKKVMPGGYALAVDVESNFFDYVTKRAHEEGQYNLFCVECTPEDPRLPAQSMDVILIVDTLHHIEGRPEYYQTLKKALRKGGRVVIVDFKKHADIPVGPKPAMRLKAERVKDEFEAAGFEVQIDSETLDYQYILTATPEL